MNNKSQLNKRVNVYIYSTQGQAPFANQSAYILLGPYWCSVSPKSGMQNYIGNQAENVIDAVFTFDANITVPGNALLSYAGKYYLVTAVVPKAAMSQQEVYAVYADDSVINIISGSAVLPTGSSGYSVTVKFAETASYINGSIASASLAQFAVSASYAGNADTSTNAISASWAPVPVSASFATSASWAPQLPVVTSSYANTASVAPDYLPLNGGTLTGQLTASSPTLLNSSLTLNGTNQIAFRRTTDGALYNGLGINALSQLVLGGGNLGTVIIRQTNGAAVLTINSASLDVTGSIRVTGSIKTDRGFIGDGSQLTGIVANSASYASTASLASGKVFTDAINQLTSASVLTIGDTVNTKYVNIAPNGTANNLVSIGSGPPSASLDIRGNISKLQITALSTNNGAVLSFYDTNTGANPLIGIGGANGRVVGAQQGDLCILGNNRQLLFSTKNGGGNISMLIDLNGNVGIGISGSAPQAQLHVAQFVSASGFIGNGAGITGVVTSSFATSASWAPGSGASISSSYAVTASNTTQTSFPIIGVNGVPGATVAGLDNTNASMIDLFGKPAGALGGVSALRFFPSSSTQAGSGRWNLMAIGDNWLATQAMRRGNFEFYNVNTLAPAFIIDSSSRMGINTGYNQPFLAALTVFGASPSQPVIIVSASAGQTGDVFQIKDANNTARFKIDSNYNVTSNLIGSASSAVSSSYATSASWAPQQVQVSASYAGTASLLLGSIVSSSYALSASYAPGSPSISSSYAGKATLADSATSSSYALTASYALNGGTGGTSNGVFGGNFSGSFSGSLTGSLVGSASFATSASYAKTVASASYASTASVAPNYLTINNPVFTGFLSGDVISIAGTSINSTGITSPGFITLQTANVGVGYNSTLITGVGSLPIVWNKLGIGGASFVQLIPEQNTKNGNLVVSGTLKVTDDLIVTGSVTASAFKGSGAAITGIVTSSYALTASYAMNGGGAPSISSSYADTASYALNVPPTKITNISGDYTASKADQIILVEAPSATASIYLPSVSSNPGLSLWVRKVDASEYPVNVIADGSDLIDFYSIVQLLNQDGQIVVTSDGSATWMAGGSGSIAGAITSASYALSASWAPGSGASISSSYAETASYATLAQNVLGSILSSSYGATASLAPKYLPLAGGTLTGDVFTGNNNLRLGPASDIIQGATVSTPGMRLDSAFGLNLCINNDGTTVMRVGPKFQVGISGSLRVSGSITVLAPYSVTASAFNGDGSQITGVISSSFATSASWAPGSTSAISSSYALTASYAMNGGGSSINPALTTATQSTPASGTLMLYAATEGTQVRPAWIDDQGNVWRMAKTPGRTQTTNIYATVTNGQVIDQLASVVTVGSATTQGAVGTGTQPRDSYQRCNYLASSTNGAFAGFTQGRGFCPTTATYTAILNVSFDNFHSTAKAFVGLASSFGNASFLCSGSISAGLSEPSIRATLGLAVIGFAKDSTDTNVQFLTSDGTTSTKMDMGFAISTSKIYRVTVTSNANEAAVGIMVEDESLGTVLYNGTTSTTVPGSTAMMSMHCECGTSIAADANSVSFAYGSLEIAR